MGMYDTFVVLDDDPRFLGLKDFQTKDLECDLSTYVISYGRVFKKARDPQTPTVRQNEEGSELVYAYPLSPLSTTAQIRIYTSNHNVLPVLSFRETSWDMVETHYPWVELDVEIRDGKITEVRIIENPNREEVRAKLLARGVEVLDDNDRIAVRHFRKLESSGRSGHSFFDY